MNIDDVKKVLCTNDIDYVRDMFCICSDYCHNVSGDYCTVNCELWDNERDECLYQDLSLRWFIIKGKAFG